MGLYKIDREGKPHNWLVAVVWWLKAMAESLGPGMSLMNTSNIRKEQIQNLVLVPKKERKKKSPHLE